MDVNLGNHRLCEFENMMLKRIHGCERQRQVWENYVIRKLQNLYYVLTKHCYGEGVTDRTQSTLDGYYEYIQTFGQQS